MKLAKDRPMISQALFGSTTVPVLVGNLANLDTPGYRVRDLSPERFEANLKEAIAARDQQHAMSYGDDDPSARLAEASERTRGILYHDESNVSVEKQIAEINKNQSKHNLALAIMTSQFRLLEAAISERA